MLAHFMLSPCQKYYLLRQCRMWYSRRMMNSPVIKEIIQSNTFLKNFQDVGKYFKWLAVGLAVLVFLSIILLIGFIIIFSQFIFNFGQAELPGLFQEGRNLVQQGPAWFTTFFPEQQLQLEEVMQQVDGVQKIIQEPFVEPAVPAEQAEPAE